jgi:hypothetical protein
MVVTMARYYCEPALRPIIKRYFDIRRGEFRWTVIAVHHSTWTGVKYTPYNVMNAAIRHANKLNNQESS